MLWDFFGCQTKHSEKNIKKNKKVHIVICHTDAQIPSLKHDRLHSPSLHYLPPRWRCQWGSSIPEADHVKGELLTPRTAERCPQIQVRFRRAVHFCTQLMDDECC